MAIWYSLGLGSLGQEQSFRYFGGYFENIEAFFWVAKSDG